MLSKVDAARFSPLRRKLRLAFAVALVAMAALLMKTAAQILRTQREQLHLSIV